MAPTICVAEVPMAGTTLCTYSCRQPRSRNGVRRRTLIRDRMLLRAGTTVSPSSSCENHSQRLECTDTVPHCSIPDESRTLPSCVDEHFRRLIATRKDLLNIVIRTIILVQHNSILQKRVNALRAEAHKFLSSVLNNPEEQSQQAKVEAPRSQDEIVSSPENVVAISSSSPTLGPDFG
ncbi:uncharacterized protein LOC109863551 [Pseudomyrmex gracilis]|uniref:uncharacterized protein LOC109863551 n=1 Tax=Pseudomyrmex gracilis TaxID=219809 RepID=UPI000994ECF1|nr:uncharacterized protein LOC109863551 [Pseudomyrmex gracilis]